jgi:hypothetical protein
MSRWRLARWSRVAVAEDDQLRHGETASFPPGRNSISLDGQGPNQGAERFTVPERLRGLEWTSRAGVDALGADGSSD